MKALLTPPEQYRITWQKGASGHSVMRCAAYWRQDFMPVFAASHFYLLLQRSLNQTLAFHRLFNPLKNAIAYHTKRNYGMYRVEAICNICQPYLGHIFPNGPKPSGLRYCISAVALKKIEITHKLGNLPLAGPSA